MAGRYVDYLAGVEPAQGRYLEGVTFEPDDQMPTAPADLFAYLLQPRRKQEFTSWVGGGHYGPSREESVSPESLQAAAALLELMTKKSDADQAATLDQQKIEAGDRQAAREQRADTLMNRFNDGSGSMTRNGVWSGKPTRFGTPEPSTTNRPLQIAGRAGTPMTPEDVTTLNAGGYDAEIPPQQKSPDMDALATMYEALEQKSKNMRLNGEDTSKIDARMAQIEEILIAYGTAATAGGGSLGGGRTFNFGGGTGQP